MEKDIIALVNELRNEVEGKLRKAQTLQEYLKEVREIDYYMMEGKLDDEESYTIAYWNKKGINTIKEYEAHIDKVNAVWMESMEATKN